MKRFGFRAALGMICLMLFFLVTAPDLRAQAGSGTIVGVARDSSGAVVPKATITCKSVETGVSRTVTTDAKGSYVIPALPVGAYDLEASLPGFTTEVRKGVSVTVGASVAVNFALALGAVEEKVEVTAEAPQVNTTDASLGGLVGDVTIRELPLNGRDWLQLATMQAGVIGGIGQQQASQSTNSRAAFGNGESLSIAGGRPTENVFIVDDLMVNDYSNGSPGSGLGVNLGIDGIREFRVLTNEYTAQYGKTSGGVVNAVYKSGTNQFHGNLFEFLRNSDLDARNFFDYPSIPAFRRNQFGASAGGPIRKDKTFIYGNWESLREVLGLTESSDTLSLAARQGNLQSGHVAISPAIQPYLAFFPLPNGQGTGDTAKFNFGGALNGVEEYTVVKVDHYFTERTTLAGSFQFDDTNLSQPDAYDQKRTGSPSRHFNIVVNLQHTFTPAVLNTARIGLSRTSAADALDVGAIDPITSNTSLGFVPGSPAGVIGVAGLTGTSGGIGASGADIFRYTSFQGGDDFSWIKGRNTFKFGGMVERIRDNLHSVSNPLGTFTFNSIPEFLQGIPGQYALDVPGTNDIRGLRSTYFGLYIQDDIVVRPNLKVNVGVRYEYVSPLTEAFGRVAVLETLSSVTPRLGGSYFNSNKLDFAPRVGLAWDPTGSGKTSIRAGYGIYDALPLPYTMSNRTNGAPFFEQGVATPPALTPSSFPNQANGLVAASGLRASYVEPNPPRAYNQQWNLTIQRQLTANGALTVGYVGSRSVHLPFAVQDMNQVPPSLVTTAPDGHLLFPTTGAIQRINPNWGRIASTVWDDLASYNSLVVDFSKRLSHGLYFAVAYTWSKNLDEGSITYAGPEYNNDISRSYPFFAYLDKGPADFDVNHNFVYSFTWDIPTPQSFKGITHSVLGGWQLGGIFSAHTGPPFSVTLQTDQALTGSRTSGGTGGGQRPNLLSLPGCSTNATNPGNPNNYIKTQCFAFPAPGELGNLGRATLRGPGLMDFDPSLFKNWSIAERIKLQFRAEFFNLLNHPNFQIGSPRLFNGTGKIIPTATLINPPTATSAREIQFGMKLTW